MRRARWLAALVGVWLCHCTPNPGSPEADPALDVRRSALADAVWHLRAPIPTPRSGHTATLLPDGRVLVAGGLDAGFVPAPTQIYDPGADSWTTLEEAIIQRRAHHAVLMDGRVVLGGGSWHDGSLDRIDPITGTVDAMSTPTYRSRAALVPFRSGLLIVGGQDDTGFGFTTVEHLETWGDDWIVSTPGDPPVSLPVDGTVVSDGTYALYLGGRNPDGAMSQTLFDILWWGSDDVRVDASEYPPPFAVAEAVGIWGEPESNTALFTGGYVRDGGGNDVITDSTWAFDDTDASAWISPGAMASPRAGHTLMRLPGFGYLVVGGTADGEAGLPSTERLAGLDQDWQSSAPLNVGRHGHTTTRLASGRVLVVGGESGDERVGATEVFGRLPAQVLVVSDDAEVRAGDCVAATVSLADAEGDVLTPADVDTAISAHVISGPASAQVQVYADAACESPGSGVVPMGEATGTVRFVLTKRGTTQVGVTADAHQVEVGELAFEVKSGEPAGLLLWASPDELEANTDFQIGVQVKDAYENVAHDWPPEGPDWSPLIELVIVDTATGEEIRDPIVVTGPNTMHSVIGGLEAGTYEAVATLDHPSLDEPLEHALPFTVGSSEPGDAPRLHLEASEVTVDLGACDPVMLWLHDAEGLPHDPEDEVEIAIAVDDPAVASVHGEPGCHGQPLDAFSWDPGLSNADFFVAGLTPGRTTITFSATGFTAATLEVVVPDPDEDEAQPDLRPAGSLAMGEYPPSTRVGEVLDLSLVVQNDGAVAIEGPRLELEDDWEGLHLLHAAGVTMVGGTAHLEDVPAGEARTVELSLRVVESGAVGANLRLHVDVDGVEEVLDSVAFSIDSSPRSLYGWYGCAAAPGGTGGLLAAAAVLFFLLRRRRFPVPRAALLTAGLFVATPAFGDEPTDDEAPAERPRLAFLGVQATSGIEDHLAAAVSDYVQVELDALRVYRVLSTRDVAALLDMEQQRQLLGCEDDSICLAEVAGALGAERVLSGSLSRIGGSVLVRLTLLDSQNAAAVANVGRRVAVDEHVEPLLDVVPEILRELAASDPRVHLGDTASARMAASRSASHPMRLRFGGRLDADLLAGAQARPIPGLVARLDRGALMPSASVLFFPGRAFDPAAGARPLALRLETHYRLLEAGPWRVLAGGGVVLPVPTVGLRAGVGVERDAGPVVLIADLGWERLLFGGNVDALVKNAVVLAVGITTRP
jgi:hypothetical protein